MEVCAKILYQVELRRGNLDTMWGFSVEAELVENSEKQDELCCYVSRVEERSVAMNSGKKSYFVNEKKISMFRTSYHNIVSQFNMWNRQKHDFIYVCINVL